MTTQRADPAARPDGRQYPAVAWVICRGTPQMGYVPGGDANWARAQQESAARGCAFTGDRSVLMGPPSEGVWLDA